MGNRLSKIYTRTGDDGTTGLASGTRINKDSVRMEAIGSIDELNSYIGILTSHPVPADIHKLLIVIQHDLFDIGGELAMPQYTVIKPAHIKTLEQNLDQFNKDLPPLKEFILPGGNIKTATCHVARSICRRAERRCIALHRAENLRSEVLQYLNRLSDLLFVIARVLADGDEVFWNRSNIGD